MLNRGQNELRGNRRTYKPKKKRYQITVMQPKEEAAASADFSSWPKWISDYGGKTRRYSRAR